MTSPVVLLTGAQGFTGRYMKAALEAAGYRVHGWGTDASSVTEAIDITDRAAVAESIARLEPDYVVHLAAISFVAHGDAAAIYNVNVVGTRNLLDALSRLEKKPQRVLLASSANVYGDREGAIREDAPFHPQNDYAVSKVAMEHMASLWATRLPIVMVRPFNYTGVGQDDNFLLPKIVAHFKRGEAVIELGNIDVWRDFNDVRAVVDIYVGLLNKAAPGQVYNVCSGRETSVRQIIGLMTDIAGRDIEVRVNPAFVRANEICHLHGDRSRLDALVGPPPRYDIGSTLRWMYES
ncbi:NAD-dependent epimerase/dehydratase family protein [Luteibacter sp. HA06]